MFSTTVEIHPNVLSATGVLGDSIVNRAGEDLGKIDELMLDLEKGRITSAVLSFDAMGMDEDRFPYAEGNKDLCRRFIQKIVNKGELSLIGDFMSPDVVNHELVDSFGDSELPHGHNIEWMTDLVYLYRHAFPDLHVEVQDQIAEGDRVVTCFRMQGTQKKALMTIAASGRKIDIAGIRVDRLAGGRIIESWSHLDVIGMLRQLAALPALNGSPQQGAPASHKILSESRLPPVAGWNPDAALPQAALVS